MHPDMSLPSRYASEGLSSFEQRQVITSGKKRQVRPVEYVVRDLDQRITAAYNYGSNEDVEMIPMDNAEEVEFLSHYLIDTRVNNDFPFLLDLLLPESKTITKKSDCFLVVDTNFLLLHLNILHELKVISNNYSYQITIPTTVMLELDGLKKSTSRPSGEYAILSGATVGLLARRANDWIYSSLAESHPSVRGQQLNEKLKPNTVKDESILDCCLYFQRKFPHSLIVLMSNDKNFCATALSNGVLTVSFRPGMTSKLIANTIEQEIRLRIGNQQLQQLPPHPNGELKSHVENERLRRVRAELPSPTSQQQVRHLIYLEVEKLLIHAVKKCMRSNYGDEIHLARGYDESLVRSLPQCAEMMKRFWSVFRDYFRGAEYRSITANSMARFDAVPVDRDDLLVFLRYWEIVLKLIYSKEMDESQNHALFVLTERWNSMAR